VRDLFRVDDPKADLSYLHTRTPRHEGAERSRNNCDELWRQFEPYAGEHFLAEFPYRFHQRWFEMYLAVALLRAGLDIHCPDGGAPDVQVRRPGARTLWIEATAPTGGDDSNPDRVGPIPLPEPGGPPVAGYVPTGRITMRVSGAFHEKSKQLKRYRESGVVGPEDETLIAINVALVPHGAYDAEEYGLAAIFGFGPRQAIINRETGAATDLGRAFRSELQRNSGNAVDVAPFMHPGLSYVSAALISGADAANCPALLGHDFVLFANPHGTPVYSQNQIPVGREWRYEIEGEGRDRLAEMVEHSKEAPKMRPRPQ